MFAILLTIVIADVPRGHLISLERFDDLAACQAQVEREGPNIEMTRRILEQRYGLPARLEARCIDTTPGREA